MLEKKVTSEFLKFISKIKNIRMFRNNQGFGFCGKVVRRTTDSITLRNHSAVKFGLFVGSGDFIGWTEKKITPDMIGQKVAVFTSIELKKSKGGKVKNEQKNWVGIVKKSGGIAIIINDAKKLESEFERYGYKLCD